MLIWTPRSICAFEQQESCSLLAIFDYGFQWWKIEQDLRMTDEEMREELKMMNGDPQIAARRRAFQRQLMMNRIQSTVPKADVVITNPTELAIAIQFDPKTMPAPVVLAKGAGKSQPEFVKSHLSMAFQWSNANRLPKLSTRQ